MLLPEKLRKELLSFDAGKPIIVTPCNYDKDCEKYSLTVFVRTVSDSSPKYINSVQLTLFFPPTYPSEPPRVNLYKTQLFHPNFTIDGEWVDGRVNDNESISDYLMRLVRVLQFKEIDVEHIGNRNAAAWFNRKRNSGIFPTDIINYTVKPRILIIRINGDYET